MRQVIKETVQYMWRSEKNRLFMIVATIAVFLYSIFILPNISGENEVDINVLEREMAGNVVQFEEALDEGLIVPSAFTGTTSYSQEINKYINQRELLTALKQGDAKRYISIPYRPEVNGSNDESYLEQMFFNIFAYEAEQVYQSKKNQSYINNIDNISFHTIHERTSLQQIHLFLTGLGPVFLLIGLLFLISDVHAKDRLLKTQKIGVPMNWQKYLFFQAIAALGFVTAFYVGLLLLFTGLNSVLYGLGSFNLPIGYFEIFSGPSALAQDNYQIKTIGWFIVQVIPYLLLLSYLFTRFNTLLSLWTRHSVITMVLGIFTILFQFIYYGSDSLELLGVDVSYFPQTYINFGQILTGRFEQRIQLSIPNLFTRGLFILSITIFIIEFLIYISSKKITRQKFVK